MLRCSPFSYTSTHTSCYVALRPFSKTSIHVDVGLSGFMKFGCMYAFLVVCFNFIVPKKHVLIFWSIVAGCAGLNLSWAMSCLLGMWMQLDGLPGFYLYIYTYLYIFIHISIFISILHQILDIINIRIHMLLRFYILERTRRHLPGLGSTVFKNPFFGCRPLAFLVSFLSFHVDTRSRWPSGSTVTFVRSCFLK